MKILTRSEKDILLDDEDYERVLKVESDFGCKWHVKPQGHVSTFIGHPPQAVQLSRVILRYSGSLDIDHKDRNTSNYQKENLRLGTTQQNLLNCKVYKNNSSGFVGVSWEKKGVKKKWRAQIRRNGKPIWWKLFETKEEAYEARQKKLTELNDFVIQQNIPQKL